MSTRSRASINVYLVLTKNDEVLLSKRYNTGYEDGKYSFVAGHVESRERAKMALVREAKEEIGIHIEENDLTLVHIMQRISDRENVDLYFACTSYQGTIENKEPYKCDDVRFFPIENLPENVICYIRNVLQDIQNRILYSEIGFEMKKQ